jgi:hypothetical protein
VRPWLELRKLECVAQRERKSSSRFYDKTAQRLWRMSEPLTDLCMANSKTSDHSLSVSALSRLVQRAIWSSFSASVGDGRPARGPGRRSGGRIRTRDVAAIDPYM